MWTGSIKISPDNLQQRWKQVRPRQRPFRDVNKREQNHGRRVSQSAIVKFFRTQFQLLFHFSSFYFSRHGSGCERTLNTENNLLLNEFIGNFRNGKKNGEGQRFYDNGIYDGGWCSNKRSGRGIMWYHSGELYFGEWKKDVYDGSGVLVKGDLLMNLDSVLCLLTFRFWLNARKLISTANGNRFEGSFSNGMKHGEGTFYHCGTGQVQKGIWMNSVCKCSMMQDDEIRFRAAHPTPFPIPQVRRHINLSVDMGKSFFSSYPP